MVSPCVRPCVRGLGDGADVAGQGAEVVEVPVAAVLEILGPGYRGMRA
jgi:hypothetical protein